MKAAPTRRSIASRRLLAFVIAFDLAAAADSSAYEQLVAPFFHARCVECHGEKKQKAKLTLHTWDGLTRGSDAGPVLVAGQPTESALLSRLRLPLDDEEHMPPNDRPQPAREEIELLARWIERGASRTATLAELRLPDKLAKAATELPPKFAALTAAAEATHAEPLWEFDAVVVAQARAPLAEKVSELQRRFPGALSYESRTSGALHFTTAGLGREFGDAELATLGALHQQLVVLNVSGTAVTDSSAPVLTRLVKLRVLRASFTELGDAVVDALAGLSYLIVEPT